MPLEIPGLSLSILRQDTRIQTGKPVLISGRLTAFGLGVPGFIRVVLEGPSYDPQQLTFTTFSSPFSGDYSVTVKAEKGGSYEVYAQATPPPLVPSTPLVPEAVGILPAVAESTHPPLVVGNITEGGVNYNLPDGTSQFLSTPPSSPIEVKPIINVAPGVTVYATGVPQSVYAGIAPTIPVPYTPEEVEAAFEQPADASVEDISLSPAEINPGQEATGVMSWRNTGTSSASFDAVVYLVDQYGARHGPLQITSDNVASPGIPQLLNLRLNTTGLPSGNYSAQGEVYNSVTGQLVDSRTVPYRLTIRSIEAPTPTVPTVPSLPEVPEVPEVPEIPEVELPELPTADMLMNPAFHLPREVRVGDDWAGSVDLPTTGLADYYLAAQLVIISPSNREYIVGDSGRTLRPGETLNIPVDISTTYLEPGTYNILLRVADQYGTQLHQFSLGFLTILAAIEELPEVPEAPTLPTRDMIQTPYLNVPSQVDYGDPVSGNITVPTSWPATLPTVPNVPSYPYGALVQLESPIGQRFNVADVSGAFTPGRNISIPLSYDTDSLPEAANYNWLLTFTDFQGREIWDGTIGSLQVLPKPEELIEKMPGVEEIPEVPEIPEELKPSEFTDISIELGPSEVEVGKMITIPVKYTHIGFGKQVIIRASIGDMRFYGFDEVWGAERSVAVPDDPVPMARTIDIYIPITSRLAAAGLYTVEAKVNHYIPEVITRKEHLVRVLEAPPTLPPPELTASTSVRQGGSLSYSFKGFQPMSPVSIHVAGGGGLTKNADSKGEGSGSFTLGEAPGSYVLVAEDSFEHRAVAHFEVTGEAPALTVNTPIEQGGTLSFSFVGFQPNSPVDVHVAGGGGLTVTADSMGRGSSAFQIGEEPGDYVLVARDAHDHVATARFTITAAIPEGGYKFSIAKITGNPSRIQKGGIVYVSAAVTNATRAVVEPTVYFSFYEGSALPGRGTFLAKSGGMRRSMQPGETFTFQAARIERADVKRVDVNCSVTIAGQEIASREDDDVYWVD